MFPAVGSVSARWAGRLPGRETRPIGLLRFAGSVA
jgi:hypothetical protein